MSDILKTEREIFNKIFDGEKIKVSAFTGELSTRIDEVDANTTYIGKATVGSSPSSPVWQIQKMTKSGTVTNILWANGDTKFDKVWDNRTTYSYS